MLEFIDRQKKGDHGGFPPVLVATNAEEIPIKATRALENMENIGGEKDVGNIKFFLDDVGLLFIVSRSANEIHGMGVSAVFGAIYSFKAAFRHFLSLGDVKRSVTAGIKTPDAAVMLKFPSEEFLEVH